MTTGPSGPNTPAWSDVLSGTTATYGQWMTYLFTMQNLTAAPAGALSAKCLEVYKDAPHKCFMAQYAQVED